LEISGSNLDSIAHPKERKENSLEAQKSSITKFGERKKETKKWP